MKIAMISEHASPLAALGGVDAGGQNVHVAELACALGARGHRVTVYTRRDARTLPQRVRIAPGVDVVHIDAGPPAPIRKDALLPYMDAFGAALLAQWAQSPPDVAHSHFWMSGVATRIAVRPLGVPWVHTYHALGAEKRREQGPHDSSPSARIAIETEILDGVDAIVATSSAEIFEHRRTGDSRKLKLVPCGVALTQFEQPAPPVQERSQRYRIATLSRLVERKGIADVILALAHVPATELAIAGGGDCAEFATDPEVLRLRRIAEAAGVIDRVRFVGRVARADVPNFLRGTDVVVCVPRYEPFGIVPLEAMACARPVVVSRVGGLVDTVVDGLTGVHVPPSQPLALASVLADLLPDAARRRRLGDAGRRRVERRYTWSKVAEETEAVYLPLVASVRLVSETTA